MLVNFIVATWLFSQTGDTQMQHKDWKTFMFKLTRVVSLHFAFSLLLPEWFTWLGFATICTIMIFKELAGHNKLQPIYDWSYKKFDSAMDYASTMFSVRDQEFAADNAV
ncbi:hypothetical protein HanHA300_Chr04g0151731 [Helianthus annuus]|nr:hypothetical protein HanHA300_Chr04g0151731 [Helianthus annuus]KAJ0598371.1 hypothetical protein HanHA89_Chr04g0165081 [Helianthus annuus]